MTKLFRFLLPSIFFFLIPYASSGLTVPENLEYDLSLGGVKVGTLSMAAADDGSRVRLVSKVDTVGWVSVFYEVNDRAEAVMTKSGQKGLPKSFMFLPLSYRLKMNEGPHRADKEFSFEQSNKKVGYSDLLNREKSSYVLKETTFDPLSTFYYIRHLPLHVGKSVFVNVFNNKSIHKVEIRVMRKEKLRTPLGDFDTVLIRSNMNGAGDGVVYYPGEIMMWLTDDEKRTPVKIEKRLDALVEGSIPDFIKNRMPDFIMAKLSSGSVVATLVKN